MSQSTAAVIILVLGLVVLLLLAFVGSRFLLRRALFAVIRMFRQNNAVNISSAKTQEDLGFKSKGMFEFRGLRDYRPMALQLMIRNNIVQVTEDGRMFLDEEVLAQTNLEQKR